ncbi:exocyst complex component Sec3-domain-containing protein [Nemania sp. FL0916]|nr:exocyst complex component Sec3-domain-containing protein [Nemania sp. FL0916]
MEAPRPRAGPGPGAGPGTGTGTGPGRDVSRAEKFEDEKRRIVDSCFNKKDTDGSIIETYITHIRITEFGSHPTSPPPPESRQASEKPRVIIVSVRKSGRVRMHKSKENANGSFSIGKTWDLNDLTAIESFTAPTVEPEQRRWAGETGFIVSIGKPYYWQAQADKEKKFFIASLIKIYGKYTGGGQPELKGFDVREQEQVLGSRKPPAPRQPPAAYEAAPPRPEQTGTPPRPSPNLPGTNIKLPVSAPRPDGLPPPRAPSRPPSRPGSRPASRSRPEPKVPWSETPPPPTTPSTMPGPHPAQLSSTSPARNLGTHNGTSSPAPSLDMGRVPNQLPALRRLASNNKSQDSFATSISTAKSDDAASIPPRSRGGMSGSGTLGRFGDPQDIPTSPLDLPDRKRPPMDPLRPQGTTDNDLVPAPLMSQASRREPPPRSTERITTRNGSVGSHPDSSPKPEKPDPIPERVNEVPSVTPASTNGAPEAAAFKSPVPETIPTSPPKEEEEETRPGLGPMIKAKKSQRDIAGTLWKAASAAGTFKPRPGGAGERLREAAKKAIADGPDGITSVVPAPPRPVPPPEAPKPVESIQKPDPKSAPVPEVKLTMPNSTESTSLEVSKEVHRKHLEDARKEEEAGRMAIAGNDVKYFSALGVDTTLLADPATEFARWLDHFGWVPGNQMRSRNFDDMKLDIERELNKAQAGGWVARFQEEDERVDAIKKGLDAAITECDELDNLLTLYSVELSTLSDDIAYIEAQGQGLQVQASNQKLLRNELESLLDICAITENDLKALKVAPLETTSGVEEIEAALVTLYKAMTKIDRSVTGTEPRKSEDASMNEHQASLNPDYGKMRIVQEKKEMYISESRFFLNKLGGFMSRQFDKAIQDTKSAISGALSKKVDARNHDTGRNLLWKYSPLVLYAKEVNVEEWDRYLLIYQEKHNPLYRSEFKDILDAWKRNARKPAGDDSELLFTAQIEKQHEGTMATARRVTVKRSQTLARSLGRPLGDGNKTTSSEKGHDGRSHAYEIFAGVMDDLLPLVVMEQNFIVDFFHATTLETADFPDLVAATRPRDRQGGDLKRHRLMEPDRELARRVTRAMEAIFAFLEQDLQNLVLWILAQDPLQGVGVLAVLERKQVEMTSSSQDFLNNILQKLNGSLESRFSKFVEDQIRAIEDTKVKIKKRKGVISFMRVFPNFSAAVENMLSTMDTASSVRRAIDREYERIIKSMFDSLKVIARENPATLTSSSADPEDKEALNYHILLIENMNHFCEELNTHGLEVLEDWKEAAASEMAEHMSLYLNAVMRRPLGKLLEYLENLETQMASGKTITIIAAQPSNSKATFNKILSAYDGREVRKGIEALRKRVEKHFGDADDPSLSRELVNRVLRECEKFYNEVEVRISTITTTVYGGDVLFEWPRADVKVAFSTTGR